MFLGLAFGLSQVKIDTVRESHYVLLNYITYFSVTDECYSEPKLRILVIDDDLLTDGMIQCMLESASQAVFQARNGVEAFQLDLLAHRSRVHRHLDAG
jgi:hypothetical protein